MQAVRSSGKRTSLVRTYSVTVGALLSVVGCANIIGLSDYKVTDGSGGTPSTGGSTSGGGTSTGGSPGTGGAATGGVGGAPAFTGCDNKTPMNANVNAALSCLLYISCSPFAPPFTMSDCISRNILAASAGRGCSRGATSCGQIESCEGDAYPHAGDCTNKTGSFCKDNRAVDCDGQTSRDCTIRNATCEVTSKGAACKVLPSCSDTDPEIGHCSGSKLYRCVNGVGYGLDCGKFAANCEVRDGEASCYYGTNGCGADGEACVNNVKEICVGNSRFRYDCTEINLKCDDTNKTYCLAPTCTPDNVVSSDCTESCIGSKLRFCYGGKPFTFNCETVPGLTACEVFKNDEIGTYASCVPK